MNETELLSNRTIVLPTPLQMALDSFSWFFIVTTFLSLIGNALILFIICVLPKFRRPSNYLIANISVASVTFMISVIFRKLENKHGLWDYDDGICTVLTIFHKFPVPLISMTVMAVSLDRIRVVRKPLETLTTRKALLWILGIWIFCAIFTIPKGFSRHYDPDSAKAYKCKRVLIWENVPVTVAYGLLFLVSVHIVPAVLLIKEMLRTVKRLKFISSRLPHHLDSHERRRMLLRNSCIYSAIFISSWLPHGFARCLLDFPPNLISMELYKATRRNWDLFRSISLLHVSFNPILLFLLSHDLRHFISSRA